MNLDNEGPSYQIVPKKKNSLTLTFCIFLVLGNQTGETWG